MNELLEDGNGMRGLSDTIINFKKGTNNYGIKDIIDLLKANGKVADSCFVGIRNSEKYYTRKPKICR